MRRVISLWLPSFATERWHRRQARSAEPPSDRPPDRQSGRQSDRPLALVAREGGRSVLAAVDGRAAAAGLAPGMPLAGAHALAPELRTAPFDPAGDRAALARLADWGRRYTPWTTPDGGGAGGEPGGAAGEPGGAGSEPGGAGGILLDVTGCAHLFGGEAALVGDLAARLDRLGFTARLGLAETPGAAWALARFGESGGSWGWNWIVVPPGGVRAALAPLPPAALRLPAATCELLARLGLRRIGDLYGLPPEVLAPRFGPRLARRLRQALGEEAEPISPAAPPPRPIARRVFAEPIAAPEDLARVLQDLAIELCRLLEAEGLGARRLDFVVQRVDGSPQGLAAGTSRPSRDPAHLARLFAERLEAIDPGFGIEVATLAAPRTQALVPDQINLMDGAAGTTEGLAALIDRLEGRLGPGQTFALAPRESHLPERAVARCPALAAAEPLPRWEPLRPLLRPLRLFAPPEPVEALALLPDHPPVRFRWRRLQHRVVRAEGPERIAGEWWREEAPADISDPPQARDYFRVEDEAGRRYWLYRALCRDGGPDGGPDGGRWFLHGLFP